MATEHRRRQDENGNQVHERHTDSDVVARAGNFLDRYKIWWFIVVGITAWFTRTVMVPLRTSAMTTGEVQMINKKIDNEIIPRLDSADVDRTQIIRTQEMQGRILGVLSRMQCLQLDAVDRAKIDLNCRDIPITVRNP